MATTDRKYRNLTYAAFGLLWLYVWLRAWLVPPLHDEVATYFHFIEPGNIWGEHAQLDANNHLLNSVLGRLIYRLSGESFFFFRLPNVLCFALYFSGMHYLLRGMKRHYRFLVLFGITSIPYVLEYFAYTRGYGISITCFIWVLVFAEKLTKNFRLRNLAGIYLCTFLAIAANISFFTTGVLVLLLSGTLYLIRFRELERKQHLTAPLLTIGFLLSCKPLYGLSMRMKEAGTLYYGSLDGLWDVTGKTLSRYVLFTDSPILCWIFLTIFLLLAGIYLRRLLMLKLSRFLQTTDGLLFCFFFGLITLYLALALLMQVNYPEDRVAMALIPLFLLIIALLTARSKTGEKLAFAYTLFPVSLLLHLSFTTSVFTPDERISDDFYAAVKEELSPASTLAGYPTMQLTWALHERNAPFRNFMHLEAAFAPDADVVLVKSVFGPRDGNAPGYRIIARDDEAGYIAYKRKSLPRWTPVLTLNAVQRSGTSEFVDLFRFPADTLPQNKRLRMQVSGTLFQSGPTEVNPVIISSTLVNGEGFRYEAFNLRWYHGIRQLEIPFLMEYEFAELHPDEQHFVLYVWNLYKTPLLLKNVNLTVYEIE